MYMMVEKDLHIKVIDSLNFLPMKLTKLLEVFGLKNSRKVGSPISSIPGRTNGTLDPTQTPNTTDVTLWEKKNERNAWPGSNPKRTASSILRKKC